MVTKWRISGIAGRFHPVTLDVNDAGDYACTWVHIDGFDTLDEAKKNVDAGVAMFKEDGDIAEYGIVDALEIGDTLSKSAIE